MGKYDISEKEYFKNNEMFSNIFNYFLYDGQNEIKKEDLEELDTKLVFTNPVDSIRERDIYKKAIIKNDGERTYLLLGIENQTKMDKYMLLRIIGYNYFSYYNQIQNIEKSNKDDKIKLYPVITLIIYFSYKKWSGPKDLYSLLDIKDERIKKYISNEKLNIIEPYNMNENDFVKLNNELAFLFRFIKKSGNKDNLSKLVLNSDYREIDIKTVRLINRVTSAEINLVESEGRINMCKAINDMKKESRQEGILEGERINLNKNIKTMNSNGADEKTIAKLLGLDIEFVKKVLNA
jgi:hypothetical protein